MISLMESEQPPLSHASTSTSTSSATATAGSSSSSSGTTAKTTLVQLPSMMAGLAMEDALGIVYVIENPQQFWSELEDIVVFPRDYAPTLEFLDSTLKRFVSMCAAYHEQYLHTPLQVEHACNMLLASELFAFHSERMCENLVRDAQETTDPHIQFITYTILLYFGRRRPEFFRSQKRWKPLLPLLMDHVLVEIDADIEGDTSYGGAGLGAGGGVPVEVRLRILSVKLLYEVCRLHKFEIKDLRIFDDHFIDYLFDLVEQTRDMHDDTFNYSVIKLIVALNEQFMVASLSPNNNHGHHRHGSEEEELAKNRVLRVLVRRLGSSRTFSENMIFMLNRAQRTAEDLCMQLLVLKLLYLLFTTRGTEEFFYTNDLRVLVDVFLREMVNLDEESDSLRHTYLRVLHPLLTKTQLRSAPYKRPQIVYALESLLGNSKIREINPTTKRLVERCLSGEWCVQLRAKAETQNEMALNGEEVRQIELEEGASLSRERSITTADGRKGLRSSIDAKSGGKTLKSAKSMEFTKKRQKDLEPVTGLGQGGSNIELVRRSPPPPPLPTSVPGSPRPTSSLSTATPPTPTRRSHLIDPIAGRRSSNASVMSTNSISAASLTGVALASHTGPASTWGFPSPNVSPTTSSFLPHAARRKGSVTSSISATSDSAASPVTQQYHAHPHPPPPKSDSGVLDRHHHHHHNQHQHHRPRSGVPHSSGSIDGMMSEVAGPNGSLSVPARYIPISMVASASTPDLVSSASTDASSVSSSSASVSGASAGGGVGGGNAAPKQRRMPPPVPSAATKRRKPPAVPIRTIRTDATG